MKKFAIFFIAAVILLSGCIDQSSQRVVKSGDQVSVDYVGSTTDGKIFDTSIESVAKENDIVRPDYKPLSFTVGRGEVIKGFDKGVIGMKVGESKTLEIPPEDGYGPVDPRAIQTVPIIENISATDTFPKIRNFSVNDFNQLFGSNHSVGDTVTYPRTNVNMTVLNISDNVSLSFNLPMGYEIYQVDRPWNDTVVKIDEKNITVKHKVKKNETLKLSSAWNTTVIDMNETSLTLRHNAVPDTKLQTLFGSIRVHFNETHIILDQNNELAGKTLIFNVTLRSINESKK